MLFMLQVFMKMLYKLPYFCISHYEIIEMCYAQKIAIT